ncbi:MAG: DUF4037 domain-containing protein [Chloroflexota bacterium]
MEPPFLPGLELSAALYAAVEPILQHHFPGLGYAAARIARGSDVLGFDDERSTDHYWGPLLELFVSNDDRERSEQQIHDVLAAELPFEVRGYSTHFRPFEGSEAHFGRLGHLAQRIERPINHGVSVMSVQGFFHACLHVDPLRELEPVEWLLMSEQNLRMVTSGPVFVDDPGELSRARRALTYYPHEVWLYLLAAQWARIGQEEAFVGRTAEAGDELGSRLVGARLVRDVMRLAFLLERTYAPYTKWLGTAFNRLRCASELGPHLEATVAARDFPTRETHLNRAYEHVARMHNALGVTERVPEALASFHGRPYQVLHADRFAEATEHAITSQPVRSWPKRVGSVSQWADATDVLDRPSLLPRLRHFYTASSRAPVDA